MTSTTYQDQSASWILRNHYRWIILNDCQVQLESGDNIGSWTSLV